MDYCCRGGGDGAGALQLPPGFRFHPTDAELVMYYLCRKCAGLPLAAPVIAEVDLYKFDPWQLPEKAAALTGGGPGLGGDTAAAAKEWYFFSPRDRKYPNGSRPNRAAGTGYWKATGADKPVGAPRPVAIKKALVFYAGKPPRGVKTNWIMHEYRLADVDRSAAARRKNAGNNALRLDDWVLCRIYNKKGVIERYDTVVDDEELVKPPPATASAPAKKKNSRGPAAAMKVETHDYGYYDAFEMMEEDVPSAAEMLCFDRPYNSNNFPPLPLQQLEEEEPPSADRDDADSNNSIDHGQLRMLHNNTDNSSSGGSDVEHGALSPSPDLPDRDHAESQPGGGWFLDNGAVVDDGWGNDDHGGLFVIDGPAAGAIFGLPAESGFASVPDAAALGEMLASYMQRPYF